MNRQSCQKASEMPQIVDRNNARNFICPFVRTRECGCSPLCMAWVSVGDDKGRCGLVNLPFSIRMYPMSCEA